MFNFLIFLAEAEAHIVDMTVGLVVITTGAAQEPSLVGELGRIQMIEPYTINFIDNQVL